MDGFNKAEKVNHHLINIKEMNSIFFKNRFILGTANFTQNYGADKTKKN